jgi:hypothetical protein
VPWVALFDQFGQGYKEIRFFRRDFLRLLELVKGVYPGARFGSDRQGMCLEASPPPVTKRLIVVTHIIPDQLQEANREFY